MPDLIILHGPPASGKLTIANELSQIIGARVFHNHLTLDVAKSLLEFGAAGFWELVAELRILSLQSFCAHGRGYAITTWCFEDPNDLELYQAYKNIVSSAGGRVLPVFLNCDAASLEGRVAAAHRQEMGKLTDVNRLSEILSFKNYAPIPDELCMEIDSARTSAKENALGIVSELNLKRVDQR